VTDPHEQVLLGPPGTRPQEVAAERGVIGDVLGRPAVLDDIPRLTVDDFHDHGHRRIWTSVLRLHKKNETPTLERVNADLQQEGQLEAAGGTARLVDLEAGSTGTLANTRWYAEIVLACARARHLIKAGSNLIEAGIDPAFTTDTLNRAVRAATDQISDERHTSATESTVEQIIPDVLNRLQRAQTKGDPGIPTGYPELDDFGRLQRQELVLIAGRPSSGKTSLGTRLIRHLCVAGYACGLISVEVPRVQALQNMLAAEAGLQTGDISSGTLSDEENHSLLDACERFVGLPLVVNDDEAVTIADVRAAGRRMVRKHGCQALLLDYLQLLKSTDSRRPRREEVAEMSQGLKQMARELDVPVIALAQLNRQVEGRKTRRPMLSDLKESGDLEQDADKVWLLWRPEYYDRDKPELKGVAYVEIAKNRNGPTGTAELRFEARCMRFYSREQTPGWMPRGGA